MASLQEIMQVCRLCLVSDQVNVPIFDGTSDIRETFAKISSCLPVKVSKDDNLPKKICEGCSYKLDLLYDFRNTSVSSEKQLLQWLQQIGVSSGIPTTAVSSGPNATTQTNSDILVKQESFEHNEGAAAATAGGMSAEAQSYIMQQQKLPYRQEFPGFGESSTSTSEPPPKRARRAAAMKAPIAPETDSDEDDLDNDMTITKAESDDDSDEPDQPSYVDATSTSVDDQPGPSGVGKPSVEASKPNQTSPSSHDRSLVWKPETQTKRKRNDKWNVAWKCTECPGIFSSAQKLRSHIKIHHTIQKQFIDSTGLDKGRVIVNQGFKPVQRQNNKIECDIIEILSSEGSKQGGDDDEQVIAENSKSIECGFNYVVTVKSEIDTEDGLQFPEESYYEKGIASSDSDEKYIPVKSSKRKVIYKGESSDSDYDPMGAKKRMSKKGSRRNIKAIREVNIKQEIIDEDYQPDNDGCSESEEEFDYGDDLCDEDDEALSSPSKKKKRTYKHLSREYTCKTCFVVFDGRKKLNDHLKTHMREEEEGDEEKVKAWQINAEENTYICTTCLLDFKGLDQIVQHVKQDHADQLTCVECNMKILSPYRYCHHMKQHSDDQLFKCPFCDYAHNTYGIITSHIKSVHYGKFSFTCHICKKRFNDTINFRDHKNKHLGLRPFVCVVCNKSFIYSRELRMHQTRTHSVTIEGQPHATQCPHCLIMLSRPESKAKHVLRCPQLFPGTRKVHLCDLCGKDFKGADKLKLHYRIHTGEKPYACSFCTKAFAKKINLVTHVRTHTGEKPYTCEFCGRGFTQGTPLKIHLRVHTGEKPYLCQFCDARFISKASLDAHKKICKGNPTK